MKKGACCISSPPEEQAFLPRLEKFPFFLSCIARKLLFSCGEKKETWEKAQGLVRDSALSSNRATTTSCFDQSVKEWRRQEEDSPRLSSSLPERKKNISYKNFERQSWLTCGWDSPRKLVSLGFPMKTVDERGFVCLVYFKRSEGKLPKRRKTIQREETREKTEVRANNEMRLNEEEGDDRLRSPTDADRPRKKRNKSLVTPFPGRSK